MKTGIVIITFNIPSEIFVLQILSLQKYCKDDFKIEVIDNSLDEAMGEAVKYHSSMMGVNYTKVKSTEAMGSNSHAFASNVSYLLLKDKYDLFLYLDHDCMPFIDFSVEKILADKLYAGIAQKVPTYLWPGCFMFNNKRIEKSLIDFSPNHVLALDTGGNLFKLVDMYGKDNGVFFTESYYQNQYFNKKSYNFYSIIQHTFMHFICASNWNNIEGNEERLNGLISILKEKTNL